MSELILIRHGETDWNREHRFQGQVDVPLNASGLAQARRLAERLAAERIDVFVSSDLRRARETAAPASERLAIDAHPLAGLREQGFGMLEGLSLHEAARLHPAEWAAWRRHDPDYALPGGESVRAFHARVVATVLELAARHAGRTVAAVTHGGVLDMLWRTAHGLPLAGPRACVIPNAGLNRLRVVGSAIEIVSWGEDAHVADLITVTPLDASKLVGDGADAETAA